MAYGAFPGHKSQLANQLISYPLTIQEFQHPPGTLAHTSDPNLRSLRLYWPRILDHSTHQKVQLQPQPVVAKVQKEIASQTDRTRWSNSETIQINSPPQGQEMPSRARERKQTKDATLVTGRKLGCEPPKISNLVNAMHMGRN
jgi:hypothetical protein